MVILKSSLPYDPTPSEPPPSYDYSDDQYIRVRPEKSSEPVRTPSSSASSSPISPVARSPSSQKGKGKANTWFSFSTSRTTREVHATVLRLVRDLVREQGNTGDASLSILESCADACASNSLSLSTLLQEKSIEEHTPLYWAIVKRPADGDSAVPDLLTSLISFASPLTRDTISDIRHGCLLTSDQSLFQRLRMSPQFSPLSGTDEMLLGGSIPPDNITVEELPGDEGSFSAEFEIVHFQKRMLVSKCIELEFIARARMWKLAFYIAQDGGDRNAPRPGSWCISLSLLENSPPTQIDSRLIIPEPSAPASPTPESSPNMSPISTSSPSLLERAKSQRKPRPTISIRLKTSQQLVSPQLSRLNDDSSRTSVIVSLEDSLMGSSLQYSGTSYIAHDETLRARLEARLGKSKSYTSDSECIIC